LPLVAVVDETVFDAEALQPVLRLLAGVAVLQAVEVVMRDPAIRFCRQAKAGIQRR
jgi:hypothetical protein